MRSSDPTWLPGPIGNLVLNSAFELPWRQFKLTDKGITSEGVEQRRLSGYSGFSLDSRPGEAADEFAPGTREGKEGGDLFAAEGTARQSGGPTVLLAHMNPMWTRGDAAM